MLLLCSYQMPILKEGKQIFMITVDDDVDIHFNVPTEIGGARLLTLLS